MSGKWIAAIAAGVALSLAARPTQAELITWQFGGEITSINDPGSVWSGKLQVGDLFTGEYVIDSATPDSSPSSTVGRYRSPNASMIVTLGGVEITVPSTVSELTVWNDSDNHWDGIDFTGATFSSGSWRVDELFTFVRDRSCTAFSSDQLPVQVFDMNQFDYRSFGLSGWYGSSQRFVLQGTTTYLMVPEPATLGVTIMMGLALRGRRAA
jgi:hypothetical protein